MTPCKLALMAFFSFAGGIVAIGVAGKTFDPFIGALMVAMLPWVGALVTVFGEKK